MKAQLAAARSKSANSARQEALITELRAKDLVGEASLQYSHNHVVRGGLKVSAARLRLKSLEVALGNLTEVSRDDWEA